MKIRNRWVVLALPLALAACAERPAEDAGLQSDSLFVDPAAKPPPLTSDSAMQGATLQDGQIVDVLVASDSAEIEASQLATGRAQNQQVQEFAQMMISDHGMLEDSLMAMVGAQNLTASRSQAGSQVLARAQATRQQLQGLSGAEFDRAYMQAMVQSHQATLNTIDSQLIPSAQNPQLRAALEQRVRPAVQMHLERARQIQGSLGGS